MNAATLPKYNAKITQNKASSQK